MVLSTPVGARSSGMGSVINRYIIAESSGDYQSGPIVTIVPGSGVSPAVSSAADFCPQPQLAYRVWSKP